MKSNTPTLLCIFSRYPAPGACKTRLIPALGPRGAARLQQCMTEHLLLVARRFPSDFMLCLAGGRSAEIQDWLGAGTPYQKQQGADLGERMCRQFDKSFAEGYRQVVLIGSDCPSIDEPLLQEGFRALDSHDLVLGPTVDGGYYLIGMKEMIRPLFADIGWGTGAVAVQTLAVAKTLGLSVLVLRVLHDVDGVGDLDQLPPSWLAGGEE